MSFLYNQKHCLATLSDLTMQGFRNGNMHLKKSKQKSKAKKREANMKTISNF